MSSLQIFLIIGTLFFLFLILYFLMKHKLDLRYTLIWFVFAVFLLILAVFPDIAGVLAKLVGIATPINMIYLLAFVFALLIILSLTMIVSQQTVRIKRLAQKMALMENRLTELETSAKQNENL